jgi:hypothetical protein
VNRLGAVDQFLARYPIEPNELESNRAALCHWQSPCEFEERVDTLRQRFASRTGADQFFNDPAAKFLSEAWVASKIGTARQADQVMLVPASERLPDFRLRGASTSGNMKLPPLIRRAAALAKSISSISLQFFTIGRLILRRCHQRLSVRRS